MFYGGSHFSVVVANGHIRCYIIVGHQWFTPTILAMPEADTWRITVPGESGQKVYESQSQQKKLVQWHTHVISATGQPISKISTAKRAEGMA